MPRLDPVEVICQPFSSSSRGEDRVEVIFCGGAREPQIHELWSFSEDRITHKVHPFARIDVGNFSGDCFQTDYSTEVGLRVDIYGQRFINGSAEWLGLLAPICDTGVA